MPLISSAFPQVWSGINGPTAPKHTFIVFFASIVDGQMWCSDCRRSEGAIREAFDGDDKPKAVIFWVGDKPTWNDKEHPVSARRDWGVSDIPTIIRIENGKETARIVEGDIDDPEKLQAFIYPDSAR